MIRVRRMDSNMFEPQVEGGKENTFGQSLAAVIGWFFVLVLALSIAILRAPHQSFAVRFDSIAVILSDAEHWLAERAFLHGRICDPADGVYYKAGGTAPKNEWIGDIYYDGDGEPFAYDGILGTKGRLYIPELGVSVALYDVPEDQIDRMGQDVVDAEDSAAWMHRPILHGDTPMVGDHSGQDFRPLLECPVGVRAVIRTENGLKEYTCYAVDRSAVNMGKTIVDSHGRDITEDYDSSGFVCYTCNEASGRSVTIAAFREDGAG